MKVPTDIDIEIRSNKVRNVLLALFVLCLLSFTAYQFIVFFGSRPETETQTAIYQTISRSSTVSGFVVRNEQYVTNTFAGTVVPAVPNGSKVGIGDTVAKVFSSDAAAKQMSRLEVLNGDMEYYRSVSVAAAGSMTADIGMYKDKVFDSLIRLSDTIDSGELSEIYQTSRDLREDITKKQIACGATVDVSERLNSLNNEYNAAAGAAAAYSAVTSEVSGYYINTADGFEGKADFASIRECTCADVERLIVSQPETVAPSIIGRLVTDFNWYIVCEVSKEEAQDLKENAAVSVSFPNESVADMKMLLVSKNPDETTGKVALVLRSNKMDASVASIRKVDIRITLEEYSGFSIDPRALRTVDGETGVYVELGNIVRFRKIDIIYSDDSVILAQSPEGDDDYLKQYDEIITEGTDLYDGKILV